MAIVDRTTLYSYFKTGDKPTENQFRDLIDSNFNLAENSLARGWVTQTIRDNEDASLFIENFPIPLGVRELSNIRFVWPINPDGPGDVDMNINLFYYSDIENTDYALSAFNIFGAFFKHTVVSHTVTFPFPGSTNTVVVDELIPVNLPLLHNNIQSLVVILSLNGADGAAFDITASFEFN